MFNHSVFRFPGALTSTRTRLRTQNLETQIKGKRVHNNFALTYKHCRPHEHIVWNMSQQELFLEFVSFSELYVPDSRNLSPNVYCTKGKVTERVLAGILPLQELCQGRQGGGCRPALAVLG